MPSIDLFEPRDDAALRDLLASASKKRAGVSFPENHKLAVDYLEGRQLTDVEAELNARYERTQTGDRGGQIAAQTIPLTQRYVDEAATAYSKPVTRKLTRPDGSVDEDNTAALQSMLADVSFDECMERLEQYTVLLKSAGMWFQARGGKLRAEVVWPHLITPVLPDDDWASVSDQDDYAGFMTEMHCAEGASRRYAWSEPAQVAFYTSTDRYRPDSNGLTRYDNTYVWPQTVDANGVMGATSILPLQMFTIATDRKPIGELVIDTDPIIALCNRELNLQLSILLDTLAHQSWATMMLNLLNPDSPPTQFSVGPRNGLTLGAGESASMLTSPVNYTDITNVLQTWVRMLAMAMSQSPNDFSAQAQAAASGFAKLVDSLPKVESRKKRIARWRRWERVTAWPRLAVIGDALGRLTGGIDYLATLTLGVDYQPLEFPESVPEQVQRETHELAIGLTTPAKILAKRTGMSLEAAEEEIAANGGVEPAADGDDEDAVAPGLEVEEIQKTAFNGAQVTAMQGIVVATAAGELPRDSAVAMVELAFQLSKPEAERVVGEAGKEPPKPKAPPPGQSQTEQGPPQPPPGQPPQRTPGESIGQLIRGRR